MVPLELTVSSLSILALSHGPRRLGACTFSTQVQGLGFKILFLVAAVSDAS